MEFLNQTQIDIEIFNMLSPNKIYDLAYICGDYFNNFELFIIYLFIKIVIIYLINIGFSYYNGKKRIFLLLKKGFETLNNNIPFIFSVIALDYYIQNKYNISHIYYYYAIIVLIIGIIIRLYFLYIWRKNKK